MHALIVHCHPEPASFNAALTEVSRTTLRERGFSVDISDLYREAFDPYERPEHYTNRDDSAVFSPLGEQRHAFETNTLPQDVQREIARLERADLVVFQFPIWWHGPAGHSQGMVRQGLCEWRPLHQRNALRLRLLSRQEGGVLRYDRSP